MRRAVEWTVFLALAAGLHLAVALRLPTHDGSRAIGGQGGENRASVAPASAKIAALVREWDRPPETAAEVEAPDAPPPVAEPEAPQAPRAEAPAPRTTLAAMPDARAEMPELPSFDRDTPLPPAPDTTFSLSQPDQPAALRPETPTPRPRPDSTPARPEPSRPRPQPDRIAALPQADTAPPPPPSPPGAAPTESLRPQARPERPPEPAPRSEPERRQARDATDSAPRQAQRSAGQGGSAQAGNAQRSGTKSLSAGQTQSLVSAWGNGIRARIESRMRHPGGRGGTVVLSLTVTRGGQVTAAGVARSSGNPRLDRAALAAVRSAGRMPGAPAGLTRASYSFSLPLRFD